MSEETEAFGDVVREIVGDRTQFAVAKAGGVSHPYIGHWIQGRVPQRPKLTEFAERLFRKGWIDPGQWRRLFESAGYVAPPLPGLAPPPRGPEDESPSEVANSWVQLAAKEAAKTLRREGWRSREEWVREVLAEFAPPGAAQNTPGEVFLDALLHRLSERVGRHVSYDGPIDRAKISMVQAEQYAYDKERELLGADYRTSTESLLRSRGNRQFGQWVDEVLGEHGGDDEPMSYEDAEARTGVHRDVVARMVAGWVPDRESVVAFARGFGEDVNAALVLAGYEPVGAAAEASGVEILDAGMYQLSQRVGRLLPYNGHINRETLTPAEARRQLADIEAELREEGLLTD